jgi:hypothetical protein
MGVNSPREPLQNYSLSGRVEILGRMCLNDEQQIPHPAKNAGIRDDNFPGPGQKTGC